MNKRIFWIATLVFFVIFVVEDLSLYRPGLKNLGQLNEAMARTRSQFLGSQIPAEKLDRIKEIIEQNSLAEVPRPGSEDQASETLGRLMDTLRELQIELLSITPNKIWQSETFVVYPYQMEMRCDYHQFARLLSAIEISTDLIQIKKFELATIQEEVVVTLQFEIYLFIGE
jgi:Tfp pilus assembly protein PilO